jgi:uncharacterized protein with HEPN domain
MSPSVPWPDLVGLRNILVHQYWRVDWMRVARTVTHELPDLTEALMLLRSRLKEEFGVQ